MLTFLNATGLDLHRSFADLDATTWETKDAWFIEVDMPGVPKEKIDLKVKGRNLEVRGERKRHDKTSYSFQQTFTLPDFVRSSESITATTENGVLTIQVPKLAANIFQIPVN